MLENACEHCCFPLSESRIAELNHHHENIYEDYHSGSDILTCTHCKGKILYYWVEIFDDMWHYWAPIHKAAAENLITLSHKKDYPQSEIIDILKNEYVMCRYPDQARTLKYCEGKSQIYSGPAW